MGWRFSSIPEEYDLDGEGDIINLRNIVSHRMVKETSIFGMSSLNALANVVCDWTLSWWIRYASYFHDVNGCVYPSCERQRGSIEVATDCVTHIRFALTINCQSMYDLLYLPDSRCVDTLYRFTGI